jgi:hypothetical protein
MSGHEKDERTERVEREKVAGTPASAKLPGFAPRVPPIPARSVGEEDLPSGNPPEKKENIEEVVAKAAAVAAANAVAQMMRPENLAAMRGEKYVPPKPPRKPIDWMGMYEKVEWLMPIAFWLVLYWIGQWRTVHFIVTCICIAIVFVYKIKEWFFSKEKDDDKDDEKDEDEKKEGGTNWFAWVGLLSGAVLIAVIGFVVAQHMGIIGSEKPVEVNVEKTTPAIEKKPVEVKVEKVAPAAIVPQTDEEIEAVCLARPNTAAGLRCCTALFSEYETKEQRCKDKILGQMEKSN